MNRMQATHAVAMARKMAAYARSLALRLEAIEREGAQGLENVPLAMLDPIWAEIPKRTREIDRVLADMTPRLEELRQTLPD